MKSEILQIIPAGNWFAKIRKEDMADINYEVWPIACWALTPYGVIGMINDYDESMHLILITEFINRATKMNTFTFISYEQFGFDDDDINFPVEEK